MSNHHQQGDAAESVVRQNPAGTDGFTPHGASREVTPILSSAEGQGFKPQDLSFSQTLRAGASQNVFDQGSLTIMPMLPGDNQLGLQWNPNKTSVENMLAMYGAGALPPELQSMASAFGVKPVEAGKQGVIDGPASAAKHARPAEVEGDTSGGAHTGDGQGHGGGDGGVRHEGGRRHGRRRGHGHGHGHGDGHHHGRKHHRRHHDHHGRRRGGDEDHDAGDAPEGHDTAERAGDRQGRERGGDRPGRERGGEAQKPEGTVSERAQKIMSFLQKELHLTKAQASGVLGNFFQENDQLNPHKPGDNGNAVGIAQWNGPRKRELAAFARSSGGDMHSLDTQLQFLKHELTHKESGAFKALQRTHTPEEAARVFQAKFERAGNPMTSNRVKYARMAYKNYGEDEGTALASN